MLLPWSFSLLHTIDIHHQGLWKHPRGENNIVIKVITYWYINKYNHWKIIILCNYLFMQIQQLVYNIWNISHMRWATKLIIRHVYFLRRIISWKYIVYFDCNDQHAHNKITLHRLFDQIEKLIPTLSCFELFEKYCYCTFFEVFYIPVQNRYPKNHIVWNIDIEM